MHQHHHWWCDCSLWCLLCRRRGDHLQQLRVQSDDHARCKCDSPIGWDSYYRKQDSPAERTGNRSVCCIERVCDQWRWSDLMAITQALLQLPKIVQFVASATSVTGTSITIPAAAQVGDFCVIEQGAGASTTPPTAVTPTGFTDAVNVSGTGSGFGLRAMVSYKVLVSGDPGSAVSTMGGGKSCLVFRPSNFTISSVTNSTPSQQVSDLAPTSQTLVLTEDTVPRPTIAIATFASTGTLGTLTTSGGPTFTAVTVRAQEIVRYAILNDNVTANNVTVSMPDNGLNAMSSLSFSLT